METTNLSKRALIGLHLAPGLILFVVFAVLAPIFHELHIPIYFSIFIGALLASLFEWGIVSSWFLLDRKSVVERIPFSARMSFARATSVIVVLFVLTLVAAILMNSVFEFSLAERFYDIVPTWFNPSKLNDTSTSLVLLVIVGQLLIISIISPVVEEIYFRGFLLPKMKAFKRGDAIHSFLFSLQHFLQPYGLLSRFLAIIPVVYSVKRWNNLTISIIWHCLINMLSIIPLLKYL